jgi:hypothetical protein
MRDTVDCKQSQLLLGNITVKGQSVILGPSYLAST